MMYTCTRCKKDLTHVSFWVVGKDVFCGRKCWSHYEAQKVQDSEKYHQGDMGVSGLPPPGLPREGSQKAGRQ